MNTETEIVYELSKIAESDEYLLIFINICNLLNNSVNDLGDLGDQLCDDCE